jgi:uncharacterized protein YggE
MSQLFKLLLICYLTATVFTVRNKIKQPQDKITPPEGDANNQTSNTTEQPSLPGMKGNAINATEQPSLPEMQGNASQGESSAFFPGFFNDIEENINQQFERLGNFSLKAERSLQANEGQQNVSAEYPSENGSAFASDGKLNASQPVISVNAQALGTIESNLIKISVIVENQADNARDSLTQNKETVDALIEKIKELEIGEENILNLGQMFRISANNTSESAKDKSQNDNEASSGSKGIVSYTQLEVQANDVQTAAKIIDLLQSDGNQIKYIDFSYQPETLALAVNNLISMALSDAENIARGALSGTEFQIGKLLKLNVNVNPDFKNYMNKGKMQGSEPGVSAAPKIIKVNISASYKMEARSSEEQQQPAEPAVQPEQPVENTNNDSEQPVSEASANNSTGNASKVDSKNRRVRPKPR